LQPAAPQQLAPAPHTLPQPLQACVDDAVKHNREFPAKVRMILSITTKGVVEKAVITDRPTNAAPIGRCLTAAAKRWKFAPPSEAAELELPMSLR